MEQEIKASNLSIVVIGPVYPYRGGIAHYTTMLATALAKQCNRVDIISFRRQYPRWLYPGLSDQDPSSDPLRVEAEYLLDSLCPWTWWQTARRIIQLKPDAIIIPWWTSFWAPAFAILSYLLRKNNLLLVYLIHNVLPHEPRLYDVWLARLVLQNGQGFIVPTVREKSRLLSLLPNASVMVYPHPVYDMFNSQRISKEEARKRLGVPPEIPVVLFFGIVRQYKGLKYLLDAVVLLREQGRLVYLVVAGEFWEDQAIYIRQIRHLGLTDQVKLENRYVPNDQVGVFFSAADVFVAPYVGGTQSGAVAMAQGFEVPIVTTYQVADGVPRNGLPMRVVAPGDASALAMGIRDLIDVRQNDEASFTSLTSHGGWDGLAALIKRIVAQGSN